MTYRHTQTSSSMWVLTSTGIALVVLGLIGFAGAERVWFLVAAVGITTVGALLSRLTVSVDEGSTTAAFGWGWPRRHIAIGEIASAAHVRNSWWQGWGIRKLRGGWMFNNAGRDAIELRLRSGKVFRIGTDQPAELLGAIDRARAAS